MPIDKDEFRAARSEDLNSYTRPMDREILDFLAFTPDLAYTRREIRNELDVSIFEVSTHLTKLEQSGFVERNGSYWLVTEKGLAETRTVTPSHLTD